MTNVQGANFETPINAFMLTTHDGDTPKLVVLLTGKFDQINYIDEITGVMTPIESNLMESGSALFSCYESTKDCDTWRTSAFDKDNHILYFQAHVVDSMGTQTVSMMKMGFTQSKVNGLWYPYINVAMSMNFGYAAYQYVTIKQN